MTDLLAEAADPTTDLARLAELAHAHPETRAAIAANPSTYEGLLQWLGQLGDPAVNAGLAARHAAAAPGHPEAADPAYSPLPPPAAGIDIAAIILAFIMPVVGLILGIVGGRQSKLRWGRTSGLAKAATAVSAVMIVVMAAGITTGVVLSIKAARDARNAPFCAAAYSYSDVLDPETGPASLYTPMWGFEDQPYTPDEYWSMNVGQIQAWHDEWVSLAAYAPSGEEYLNSTLDAEAEILDTSTGPNGENPIIESKDWYLVGNNVDTVNGWVDENCG